MAKPSLVLVHGSWHCTQHFEPLINHLQSEGFKCVPAALPSTQSPEEPPANMTDDTNAIRDVVVRELDKGNQVIVVSHSYGGVPANNALKGLDKKSRSESGFSTSVVAQIFACAVPLPTGASFLGALGGHPAPIHDRWTENFTGVGKPGPEFYFYNDLSAEEAKKWSGMLRQQSWPAYVEETTDAAYLKIPSSYLYCTKDQAIPYEMQQGIVKAAIEGGALIDYTETLAASHSPFLSMPKETTQFVVNVANR